MRFYSNFILPSAALLLTWGGIHGIHRSQKGLPFGGSTGELVAVLPGEVATNKEAPPAAQETQQKLFDPNDLREDCRLFLSAEALIMQPYESSLSYATQSLSTTEIQGGHDRSPHSQWSGGERVGLGYRIPHDQWDLYVAYTHFQGEARGEGEGIFFPVWARNPDDLSPFYSERASGEWRMNLNRGDFELGRNCLAGQWLSLRPFFGLRGETLAQGYKVVYEGGRAAPSDKDRVKLHSEYWGVGMRMGVNSLWGSYRGVSVYGNGSASLLSGHFTVREREKMVRAHLQKMHVDDTVNNVVLDADLALGLQWDYLFSRDRYHIGVKLGWEFDALFDQNQFFSFLGKQSKSVKMHDGDLNVQGLALGFRFDF